MQRVAENVLLFVLRCYEKGRCGSVASSREIIKLLEADGWFYIGSRGDHCYFKHEKKSGKITVPHPQKDLKRPIVKAILKQAGLDREG